MEYFQFIKIIVIFWVFHAKIKSFKSKSFPIFKYQVGGVSNDEKKEHSWCDK